MKKLDINNCLKRLKSDDALTYEEAFNEIEDIVTGYKDDILRAMLCEREPFTRAKFIELLGLCKDPSLVPVLKKELESKYDDVISWSLSALEMINTEESVSIATKYRELNPRCNE